MHNSQYKRSLRYQNLDSPEVNPMTFAERIKTPEEDSRLEYFLINLGMQQYIEIFRDN